MGLEQKINYQLNKFPIVKKIIKRGYQRLMYTINPKVKYVGQIKRISPKDRENEYFFGYYDKSPWDITDRYVLCLKASDTYSDVSPKETADILLIDTGLSYDHPNRVKKIAETRSWNVQQSCMLQWLGPDYQTKIIYNDYRHGQYCSVILNIETMEEKEICSPVYSVSPDGTFALTLDFSRLYNLRPGYGYYNEKEKTEGIALPDTAAIWKVDFINNTKQEILSYKDFANFKPRKEMQGADKIHKVNHIMINPDGKRFMVLYRWFSGQRKYTRLITSQIDGSDMYLLSDDDMVSHCYWKNNHEILAFENKNGEGPGYYLMEDKTQNYIHCWPQFSNDGHPSYSPDGHLIVTDSYPDRTRMAYINIMSGNEKLKNNRTIAKVFAPFKYDNDTRCDLHPRWNHSGTQICFDSVFEDHRGLYAVDIPNEMIKKEDHNIKQKKVTCVIPSYKRCETVIRAIDSVLAQTYKHIEVCIVDDNEPNDEYSLALQEVLKKYNGDPRVRYITQKKHINGAVARNVGIEAATGEYIGFLDDDDEWLPTKIERQMDLLSQNSSIDAITTFWTLYKNEKEIRRCAPYDSHDLQFKIFMRDVAVFTSTVLIKKTAIKRFNGFDEKLLRHQDLQFLIDALKESSFMVLPEYLVHLHADSHINRPNVHQLIEAKEEFFKSVNDELHQYSKSKQRRIKNAHYYEVAFQALKSKEYFIVIKYMLKAGFHLQSIKDLLKRIKER